VVILGAAHGAVRQRQSGLRGVGLALFIQPVLENGTDAAVIGRIQRQSAGASGFQSRVAIIAPHAQHAQTGTVTLLRMLALPQHALHRGACVGPHLLRPVEQTLGIPARHLLVRRCHVRVDGGVASFEQTSGVGGDAAAAMEYLYRGCREAHIHFLAGKPVRRRVIVAGDLDVVVDADTGDLPFGELVAICRQCLERRAVEFCERAVAASGQFLERALVQVGQQCRYGAVGFLQAEEALVAQPRQYPATSTPFSTLALSRGLRLRAGRTVTP